MILCTVDASAACERALPTAIELARRFDQPLRVLLVVDGTLGHHFEDIAQAGGTTVDEMATRYLARVAAPAEDVGLRVERAHCHALEPGPAIVAAAADPAVAMVVMATHGRSGVSRLLAGSVTEHVIRHSTKPIVVVPTRRDDGGDAPDDEPAGDTADNSVDEPS